MTDRGYVVKAADTGAGKVSLLHGIHYATCSARSAPEWA
jgi:hypothetical protein